MQKSSIIDISLNSEQKQNTMLHPQNKEKQTKQKGNITLDQLSFLIPVIKLPEAT